MVDDAIHATNDDAAMCKRFAVQQGYWKDPYIQFLVKAGERKAPEINRGYFARAEGLRSVMRQFLKLTHCACQIINLGAGFDTNFWLLKDEGLEADLFVELDMRAVTSRKCHMVRTRAKLLEPVQASHGTTPVVIEDAELHSRHYHIMWADLRDLRQVEEKLSQVGVDKNKPTLFLSECVLVYMPVDKSNSLVKWVASNFGTTFFLNYEPVNMGDRFGQVMVANLRKRTCDLAGVEACMSLETQKERFLSNGWEGATAMDMMTVYHNLPGEELQRIERLEFMDEREPLQQLMDHYCIAWAWRDVNKIGLESVGFNR
ncbi:leucine carboxyl methyltransferase 1-like isoform X2 [Acanthaster planci]|uniref:Leucine carboxyl methyltransferase 1 n=1 Tax=Acanthaster planci TaxID=133434 RepID=A0A8B7ZVX1_ACAPL|nr:leucine carboxyl methyltransferase 1-like isoform X2 [Acanthaster planci]